MSSERKTLINILLAPAAPAEPSAMPPPLSIATLSPPLLPTAALPLPSIPAAVLPPPRPTAALPPPPPQEHAAGTVPHKAASSTPSSGTGCRPPRFPGLAEQEGGRVLLQLHGGRWAHSCQLRPYITALQACARIACYAASGTRRNENKLLWTCVALVAVHPAISLLAIYGPLLEKDSRYWKLLSCSILQRGQMLPSRSVLQCSFVLRDQP
ncbi:hypothetical protein FHG87_003079 [Trinorchestia longiramus]|nr:hypothetical protein FHG87_003079 [Trinorchestia longiramus]